MNRQSIALGGLAILLVVLHHAIDYGFLSLQMMGLSATDRPDFYLLAPLYKLGPVAVPLFLFISGGFVAYMVRGNPPRLSRQSVQSILVRLLWPYAIWSTISYIFLYWFYGEAYSLGGYLKNYVVGYPFHFVPLLVFFYAISPFLVYGAKRYGIAMLIGIALYQVLLIVMRKGDTFGLVLPGWATWLVPPVLESTLASWGLYFPLGLVYALESKRIGPWLDRWRWVLLALAVGFFVVDVLTMLRLISVPVAMYIYPLAFVLWVPQIKRQWIPSVEKLEYVGKRTYGVYFAHLLMVDILYFEVRQWAPWLFASPLLLALAVFAVVVAVTLLMMHLVSAKPARLVYRYVFG